MKYKRERKRDLEDIKSGHDTKDIAKRKTERKERWCQIICDCDVYEEKVKVTSVRRYKLHI